MIAMQLPTVVENWRELGIAGMVLAGFALFVFALLSDKLVTGNRHREVRRYYEEKVSALNEERDRLSHENREQHIALERISDDYKQVIRDLISARLKDVLGSEERRA